MDGFYCAYLTGQAGNSVLMFVIQNGMIVGVDIGRMKYDGTVHRDGDSVSFSITYEIPPGANLITGAPAPTESIKIPFQFSLPANFGESDEIHTIVTPLGPVNAKIERLRGI